MEKMMSIRSWMARGMGMAALLCMAATGAPGQSSAQKLLLEKAHALEQSGHMDLAAQTWQQVLLSDPNNQEALAGLARWARINGHEAEAQRYIERLRGVNPDNPEIGTIQSLPSRRQQNALLDEASQLARAGHNEQALKIYRQVFGTHPPDNWAEAYYDTEAAIPSERGDAIRGLRALMEKFPDDPKYAVDLGRVLTYDAKTRAEGERLLRQHPQDEQARLALRQSLLWDVQNPASAPMVEEYLKQHPDEQLARGLAQTQAKSAGAAQGLAKTPAEQAAYAALAGNHLDVAERRFAELNTAQPQNPRVLAGLGFLRMKQNNFGGAIGYFEQAQQNGLKSQVIEQSLATSRFWDAMQQGTQALNGNRLQDAVRQYRAALALRPESTDALAGLAGAYMKMQQPALAIPLYEQLVQKQPASPTAWRGMFMAQALSGDSKAALATAGRFPATVSSSLAKDPEYLRALATADVAAGQNAAAERALLDAMRLGGNGADARLQYATLLANNREYARAAEVYRALIQNDAGSVAAWQGLVSLEHQAGQDVQAIALVERMPPDAYDNALRDGGFLGLLASIYQGQNHPDVAQQFLERAARLYADKGQELPIPLQLQVAAVDLQRNHADGAYRIYRSVLTQHPDHLDAWKGLLAALHQTGHDADALAQIEEIPPSVRRALNADVQYQQTIAAVYAATGNQQAALGLTARIQERYRASRMPVPADVAIQNAWALYNIGDDADLYRQLMTLGDRTDMTDAERQQVQTIWASWAQRRAAEASQGGNQRKALTILKAAAESFPGNPAVSRALAAGYAQAGDPKDALAIYAALDPANASAADYQAMVGAALAAQNTKQAEAWLRVALEKFPGDPGVLGAAAQFEQARGDTARAAEYWKASLKAMPPVAPTTELAHNLDQPEPLRRARPALSSDLASLLRPEADGSGEESGVALPGYHHRLENGTAMAANQPYGPDPLTMGTAPVQLNSLPEIDNSTDAPEANQGSGANRLPESAPAPAPKVQPRKAGRHAGGTPPQSSPRIAPRQTDPVPNADFEPHASLQRSQPSPDDSQPLHTADSMTDLPAGAGQAEASAEIAAATGPAAMNASAVSSEVDETVDAAARQEAARVQPLVIPPTPELAAETTGEQGQIAEREPEQLGLDTSSALVELPNVRDEALKRATAALAAASRPVDPSLFSTQYETGAEQIAQQTPEPAPQVVLPVRPAATLSYQRPGSPLDAERSGAGAEQQPATGASDDELMQQNLPPLRGPYQRPAAVRVKTPREQAEQQLAAIQAGYTPWLGGTGFVSHRSGTAGYDSLTALEAPFEASQMFGTAARLTIISRPVFLDAGSPTVSPILPGGISERLGTADANAILDQQNASGIGGEAQLATRNFAAGVGYTPYGFLVSNVIARASWKPANGPFTFTFSRDAVKDSQLSYAGLRDPGSAAPGFEGNIWGGVVATGGESQFGRGSASSGFYVSAGGQSIDGYHVQTNSRVNGDAGAYWRVKSIPDEGNLTLGVNFFGMHYAHNLTYFTYGQGGYFSPQAYFLAGIPVTWRGQYGPNFHYSVVGSFGVQAFQEDSSPYFPLDQALEVANNNLRYASQTNIGGNYDLQTEGAYHLTDHWYLGGFLQMNNTRDYNNQQVGFYVRFVFRPQYPTDAGPTGLYPWDGLRPYQAP